MTRKRFPIIIAIGLLFISIIVFAAVFVRIKFFHPDKTLIVYFSKAGNTTFSEDVDAVSSASLRRNRDGELEGNCEVVAELLGKLSGADVFEITVLEEYPEDYNETISVANRELADNARPELAEHIENMSEYDNIILIYPVWWSTMPMPVCTFLEEYDFSNKNIYPIATHKGSFLGDSVEDMRALCSNTNIHKAVSISGGSVDYLWILPMLVILGLVFIVIGIILRYKARINTKWYRIGSGIIICGIIMVSACIIRLFI